VCPQALLKSSLVFPTISVISMASGPPGQKEREMGHENKEMQLLGSVDEWQSKPYSDGGGLETVL